MKVFQGLALVLIWLIGLPLTLTVAFSTAWSGTGGIDSGDVPSTGASLLGWMLTLGGIALMIAVSAVVLRLDDTDSQDDEG